MSAPAYAVVANGAVVEYRSAAPNVDQALLAPGKPKILPVVVQNESYDPVTQTRTGPVITVQANQVLWTYTVASKTPAEVTAMRDAKLLALRNEFGKRLYAIMPPGEQFALLITGFIGILETGLNTTAWPAGIKNVFNPLATIAKTQGIALYNKYTVKVAEINALATSQQINDYDVTTGW